MAAADIDNPVALNGGRDTGTLSRTRDILIETMQLVEPRRSKTVPNHLLESKIYSKVAANAVIQAQPAVLHFAGFEPGVTQKMVIDLANVSTEVQRMHIIPPQSKYFYIKYKKGDRLVPGLALECTVEFTADEWRYYYDCIRVHCKGEENLVIPIHAFPVMNASDFPKNVSFPAVAVGHSRSKVIPLRCQAPIDFEFQISFLQPHPAFRVEPLDGVVPANGEVDIIVTFSPVEFNTARMVLQLIISQFNAKPLTCTFTGCSSPGIAKQLTEKAYQMEKQTREQNESMTLDPRAISPLDRARSKRRSKTAPKSAQLHSLKEIDRDGVKFPSNLDTPYAVAQVLNQQPGKLRIKDLREVVLLKQGSSSAPTRQMKEAMFEMAVRQDVYEERQNQLRWQVKVGDDPISSKSKQDVIAARGQAWTQYKRVRGDPIEEDEYLRKSNDLIFRRTRRECSQLADESAQFDVYKNDPWAVKYAALYRFQQAARKVIIRHRAVSKLKGLRQMVIDWSENKYNTQKPVETKEKLEEEEEEESIISLHKVKSSNFPTYTAPNVKDDMAVDALGSVPYLPTEIVVKKKVPFHSLKVPQHYKLMGYKPHNVHDASSGYVPPNLSRPLRTGAEEEVISVSEVESEVNEGDMRLEEVGSRAQTPAQSEEVLPIKPPAMLLRPIEYPPLHIFNPAPGLQVFQPPLPYAETDPDFHLCPLPRYTSTDMTNPHMATQKQYLDREDTVRGVMNWKRFPSQGLTSLANTPTMASVWIPRWKDPFNAMTLPEEVPELYSGLAQSDSDNVTEDTGDDETVALTPEMVLAEFPLVDTNGTPDDKLKKDDSFPFGTKLPASNTPVASTGPVPRERREQELDYFLKKRYNKLGNKIKSKVQNVNSLKTNPDLVLR